MWLISTFTSKNDQHKISFWGTWNLTPYIIFCFCAIALGRGGTRDNLTASTSFFFLKEENCGPLIHCCPFLMLHPIEDFFFLRWQWLLEWGFTQWIIFFVIVIFLADKWNVLLDYTHFVARGSLQVGANAGGILCLVNIWACWWWMAQKWSKLSWEPVCA